MESQESSIEVNLITKEAKLTSSNTINSNSSNKHPNNMEFLKPCHSERQATSKVSTSEHAKKDKTVRKSKKRKKKSKLEDEHGFVEVSEYKSESSEDSDVGKTTAKSKEEHKGLEVKTFSMEGMTRRTKRLAFDLDALVAMPEELTIVRRDEWGGKPPEDVTNKSHITTTIVFTYSTDTKPCSTLEECCKIVRKLQKMNMYGGLPDIPFNFLVGGDGRIYEGRGWHAEPETNEKYRKLKGHYVELAFIGNYNVDRPSDAMFDAALELVDYGRSNFWVKDKFGLIENYD